MSTIHLHQTTTLTPEQYIAGLTDFGPGRSKLFGNSADEYLKVHRRLELVQASHAVRKRPMFATFAKSQTLSPIRSCGANRQRLSGRTNTSVNVMMRSSDRDMGRG